MDNSNKKEKLKNLTTYTLIEIVKNYKQYNYEIELREEALRLLEERGITIDQLKLSGNLENYSYNRMESLYHSFKKYSILALIFLILSIITYPINLLSYSLYIVFLLFMFLTINYYKEFFKYIGKPIDNLTLSFIVIVACLPLYLIVLLYTTKEMKEHLKNL